MEREQICAPKLRRSSTPMSPLSPRAKSCAPEVEKRSMAWIPAHAKLHPNNTGAPRNKGPLMHALVVLATRGGPDDMGKVLCVLPYKTMNADTARLLCAGWAWRLSTEY